MTVHGDKPVYMYSVVSVVLCATQVLGSRPQLYPNVSSGDLLEYTDYANPVTPVPEDWPHFIRHDQDQNVVLMFKMHYGEVDKIVNVTEEEVLITKKKDPSVDVNEIWHLHKDDIELKQFFAKVLCLDPVHVTVVHIAFLGDESIKKVLVKQNVMKPEEIVKKVKAAVGKILR